MSCTVNTTECQCETRTEADGLAMGDVLAKGYRHNRDKRLSSESHCNSLEPPHENLTVLNNECETPPDDPGILDPTSNSVNGAAHHSFEEIACENPDDSKESRVSATESRLVPPEDAPQCSCCVSCDDESQRPPDDGLCPCDMHNLCKFKSAMMDDELKREIKWHRLWTELRNHLRSVFAAAMQATSLPSPSTNITHYECDPCRMNQLRDNVIQMCKRNSQQLLLMLIAQAQEFVVELKNQIKKTLRDEKLTNVAEIFLTRILDGYDAFVSTARQVTDLLKPVEERHLLKFNLTWEFFNKALYENHIWMSEPSMRNVTGSFTTQLTKSRKRHSYQALFERYVAFVEEMMRVADLWPETERLIVKWNEKQVAERKRRASEPREIAATTSTSDLAQKTVDEVKSFEEKDKFNDNPESESAVEGFRLSNGSSVDESIGSNGLDSLTSLSPTPEAISNVTNTLAEDLAAEKVSSDVRFDDSSTNSRQEFDAPLMRHKTDIVREMANDFSELNDHGPRRGQMCQCIYEHMREVDETGRIRCSDSPCPCVLNLRWLCGVNKPCPCLAAASSTNRRSPSPILPTVTTDEKIAADETANQVLDCGSTISNSFQSAQKQTRHSTTQTTNSEEAPALETQSPPPLSPPPPPPPPLPPPSSSIPTKNSAAKTAPATHNHRDAPLGQATCARGHPTHSRASSKEHSMKGLTSGNHHRAHAHANHASHACHKQSKVEHIERVLCTDVSHGDGGDCSDSGCSQDDSCSTSSSTPRDSSRHCDCCYCEVFGPGIPSVAPVSRNYNEMRERLRQLLTKKKATKCKVPACSPPKNVPVPVVPSNTSGNNRGTSCTTRQTAAAPPPNAPLPAAPPPPPAAVVQPELRNQPEHHDQRDLAALLDFIEGNQGTKRDNKKTEKKARQKQRKLEEMLKKAKEEAERQKLVELQKKTPEVTITVVDPQKPVSSRLLPRHNLPEVSILPAMPPRIPVISANPKQLTKKKDKKPHENDSPKIAATKSKTPTNSGKSTSVSDLKSRENSHGKQNSSASNGKKVEKLASRNPKDAAHLSTEIPKPQTEEVKLTKKQRKVLRREIKKMEEAKANEPEAQQMQRVPQPIDNQPQIVTIKRVMESNNAEPTVTITLKGQTPAEDKVLFTLVNGQTKEPGTAKAEQNQGQSAGGKKKKGKGKGNNQTNNQTQQQTGKQIAPQSANNKTRTAQKTNDPKVAKTQQQQIQQIQPNTEKSKSKKTEDKKNQQQQQSVDSTKSTKSKKNQKNAVSTEIPTQPTNTTAKSKNTQQKQPQQQQQPQQQPILSKKQNKQNASQQLKATQKPQQSQNTLETNSKNSKVQQQQQQETRKTSKKTKNTENSGNNKQSIKIERVDSRVNNQMASNQSRLAGDLPTSRPECNRIPLSSQLRDVSSNSKLNIENLKLPPGITITKVDAPAKPMPIKSAQMPKPVAAPKQTTIIAAPMSGGQSNYPGPQTGGNVIVVDTGKLKQDLLPKNNDKEILKESPLDRNNGLSGKKKKKKKKKKGSNGESNGGNASINALNRGGNDSGKENVDEPARILHNAGSNMVTIRNPAFGPPPKMDPTPQAAIIKVSENGMVTIRSPALQQAINAGLTPPSKPDFIVKGDPSIAKSSGSGNSATLAIGNRPTLTQTNSTSLKNANGTMPANLAELRSRLSSNCTSLPGLANIQISRVTNGQAIPENGINLKGTSVTLTKVRTHPESPANVHSTPRINTVSLEEIRQAKSAVREALGSTINPPVTTKNKKKKKRGNGNRQGGDDWNLVESVFTPKDIDLEDGEMDDAERELEAFKRFCLQSVPPPRKEKVNLNIKDIVLKKKSSSSSAASAAIAAN